MKMDAKIDMLHQSGLFGKGTPPSSASAMTNESEDIEDEEEVARSMSTVSQKLIYSTTD
jgi:hypothetical protein